MAALFTATTPAGRLHHFCRRDQGLSGLPEGSDSLTLAAKPAG